MREDMAELTRKINNEDRDYEVLHEVKPNSEPASIQQSQDKLQPAPYLKLFSFADSKDKVLIALATLFSLATGISIVFYAYPLGQLIDAFSGDKSKDQIVASTIRSVYGFLFNSIFVFFNSWFMTAAWTITSERQMSRVRKEYLRSLLMQEPRWHDKQRPAELAQKMYVQISKCHEAIVTNMTNVLNKVSMGASGIIFSLATGWQMSLVLLAFLPIMMLSGFVRGWCEKKKEMYKQTSKTKIDSDVIEVFDNVKTVKMLHGEEMETDIFNRAQRKQFETNWNLGWKGAVAFSFFFFCIIMNYALGFWYGSKLVSEKAINSNTGQPYDVSDVIVIFFTLYLSNLNLSGLPDSLAQFNVSRYSMAQILHIVHRKPMLNQGGKAMSPDFQICEISFNSVSFQYDEQRKLFKNLSMTFKKGITALVGASGCGKTTIISLLMRFYDPFQGSVSFNSNNGKHLFIQQLTFKSLRQTVGYVGQEPVLIGKSLREALLAENSSDSQIYEVLKIVKADQFVSQIGLNSEFNSLSGGQKQRIAIARALLKKPKVLILDESTSALDRKTESIVLEGIRELKINFVIMIAHRAETIWKADRVMRVCNGEVSEEKKDEVMKEMIECERNEEKMRDNECEMREVWNEDDSGSQEKIMKDKEQSKEEALASANNEFKMSYVAKLMQLNPEDKPYYIMGTIGAFYFGCIFPFFSYLLSRIIFLLLQIKGADPQHLPIYQNQVKTLTLILFAISVGSLIFTTVRWLSFEYITQRIGFTAKTVAFKKLINLPYQQIEEQETHNLSHVVVKSCESLKPLAGNFMPIIIENIITLFVGLGIAFYFSWAITLTSLFILPLILLSSQLMMHFRFGMQSNTEELHKKNHGLVVSSVTHIKTVKSCSLEQRILSRYSDELDEVLKVSTKYGNLSGILFGVAQTLISCTFAVIFLIGAFMIRNEWIEVDDLYTSIFAVMFAGVQAGGNIFFLSQIGESKLGAAQFFTRVSEPHPHENFIESMSEEEENKHLNGTLEFDNISFQYKNRQNPVFKGFTLKIKENEKVALVGQSGSGKSTLAALLFKLYQLKPGDGEIRINGINIKDISRRVLCKQLGIVMQEPILFNRSVYRNIKYNKTDASFDEIVEVCKKTNSFDFINEGNFGVNNAEGIEKLEEFKVSESEEQQLPNKNFLRNVGTRGCFLSGGQKQRVAIARSLIREPKILIMDEATSALDSENQLSIQKMIQTLPGMTQIIIAHRLSTIVSCDRILVLSKGKIIEQGKFHDLIKQNGYFASLVASGKNPD